MHVRILIAGQAETFGELPSTYDQTGLLPASECAAVLRSGQVSLDRHRLGQISRLVNIQTLSAADIIAEQLQRNDNVHPSLEYRR